MFYSRRGSVIHPKRQSGPFDGSGSLWLEALVPVIVSLLSVASALGQAITRVPAIATFAGDGTPGYSGDGGTAAGAALNAPAGITIDEAGNVYIADTASNRIRKVAVGTGIISTFAGSGTPGYSGDGGPAIAAELQSPSGLAIDSLGNLYIADQGNNVVRRVVASGAISTVAGNNKTGYSGDNGPATFTSPTRAIIASAW
jgi:secreted PhoX family phosphatase